MVDAASNAATPRVMLLARAGKAADHLAEAVRQAGAELLAVVDPATAEEAALRALAPQAVLVALEPSIEHVLDKLDGLLSDPALTVIYDEADVAAHRTGWDAARWARHLSAKLRHDSNVLPPGTESDQEWQPSPGQIPKPAAAYADVDLAAFTREAAAHADRVPADGTPVDSLSAITLSPPDASLVDAIPAMPAPPARPAPVQAAPEAAPAPAQAVPLQAAPQAVPPPLPPPLPPLARAPADSGAAAFQGMSLEAMSLESIDPVERAHDAAASAGLDALVADEDVIVERAPLQRASFDEAQPDGMPFDGMQLDSMQLDDVQLDGMQLDSMQLDDVQLDGMQLDGMQLDGMQLDGVADEAIAFDSVAAAPAAGVAPMQFDDDAFFLEELSATDLPPLSGEPVAAVRFDGGFDGGLELDGDDASGFESLDFDSVPSATTPRDRGDAMVSAEEVMSFEALIAGGLAASAPAPAPAPASPAFSLGGLSLAPVDEAPVVVEKAAPGTAPHDLSALEARISGLSLVDIAESAGEASFGVQATPVVLIEAGLGGPDPARQLLSSLPGEFMAVVLVRLHLQGGRYDRLVAQMERTAALPVALAQGGAAASPGTIYFLPDGIGLTVRAGAFGFVDDTAPPAAMFGALPSGASALVFLSGSDPQLVDSAMAAAATGTLVVAQSPEDCYDGAACAELRNRGIASGLPAELAGRLASRWPS